jgi:hypothetical protein
LIIHIAVLRYWLGAELVINSTYRDVCYSVETSLAERAQLMEHVMHVDQHVRYALVLQATLGLMLTALYGFVPGGSTLAWSAALVGGLWLAFIEAVHRLRHRAPGATHARIDRSSR